MVWLKLLRYSLRFPCSQYSTITWSGPSWVHTPSRLTKFWAPTPLDVIAIIFMTSISETRSIISCERVFCYIKWTVQYDLDENWFHLVSVIIFEHFDSNSCSFTVVTTGSCLHYLAKVSHAQNLCISEDITCIFVRYCTGWHITLFKTSRWLQNKSSALARPGQSGTFVLKSTGGFAQCDVSHCTYASYLLFPTWDFPWETPRLHQGEAHTRAPSLYCFPIFLSQSWWLGRQLGLQTQSEPSAVLSQPSSCTEGFLQPVDIQGDHSGWFKHPVDSNRRSVLVWGPCIKTQLLLWCQRDVWINLNGHPVFCK